MPGASGQVARLVVGYAALSGGVALVALPVAYAADPAFRPVVVRLAVALVLAVALGQLVTAARRWVDGQSPPPASHRRAEAAHPEPALDRQFLELLDGVRYSRASETYWRRVLWPRLSALAERLPPGPALVEPGRSRMRRLLGRGPALPALRALVSRLEERG
jgi:hypothetical protein